MQKLITALTTLMIILIGQLSQVALAQSPSNVSFIKKAVGRYNLVKSESDIGSCMSVNVKIGYISKKEAIFGSECGAVLWIGGAEDPMGIFFCRADSNLVKGLLKIDIWKEMSPPIFASESGRLNNETIQIVFPAKDNPPNLFLVPEIVENREVLSLTQSGVSLTSTILMKNGTIQTHKCIYKKK